MKYTIAQHMLRRIRAKSRDWVFTPKDFVDLGSRDAVDQALHRLLKQGMIGRLGRGIYYFPYAEGKPPSQTVEHIDAIARALAAQTGHRAMLTGEEAARRLHLSDTSPSSSGYYDYVTTGRPKTYIVGDIKIRFRHTSLSPPDRVSDKAITLFQALVYLGREALTPDIIHSCSQTLHPSEREQLRKLAPQAPAWLIPALHQISRMPQPPSPTEAKEAEEVW